jgi:hypothetical protein
MPQGWTNGINGKVWVGVAAAIAIAMPNCGDVRIGSYLNSPPSSPTNTATSDVSYKMFSSGAPRCTLNHRWEWTPVQVAGEGASSKFTVPQSGFSSSEVSETNESSPKGYLIGVCYFNDSASRALAPGIWDIALVNPLGLIAQCRVTLRKGANWAAARQGWATCKETPPGVMAFSFARP